MAILTKIRSVVFM